ncbi:hypothetical protein SSX86_010731 [Deinandra increscens subsp. villosa]|uniref:CRAL/TRIO N-terminal domain-containing protein n=1 Tax=Deinandra increscens subsp. villosa TaxID=3103831 RepID=A0AAP0D825_9ASTR
MSPLIVLSIYALFLYPLAASSPAPAPRPIILRLPHAGSNRHTMFLPLFPSHLNSSRMSGDAKSRRHLQKSDTPLPNARMDLHDDLLLNGFCLMAVVTQSAINQLMSLMDQVDEPLKRTFQNVHQGYKVETLERFLKARDGNVARAHKMLLDCLHWRLENGIDDILSKPIVPINFYRGVRESQLIGVSGYTREGLPVFAIGVGLSSFDKASVQYYVQSHIQINEYRDRVILVRERFAGLSFCIHPWHSDLVVVDASYFLILLILWSFEGNAIEAKVDKSNKKVDAIMKVNECYLIDKHFCTEPRASGRVVFHRAALLLANRTIVKPVGSKDIPTIYFNFARRDMLDERTKDKYPNLTDYYGRVLKSTGLQQNNDYRTVKVTLLDHTGHEIVLTLWQSVAISFTKEDITGQILAVSAVKVTKYLGRLQLDSTDITVTYINPPVSNLQEIINSFNEIQKKPIIAERIKLTDADAETGFTLADLNQKPYTEYKSKLYSCQATIKEIHGNRKWFLKKCTVEGCERTLHEEYPDDDDISNKTPILRCSEGHTVTEPAYHYCVHAVLMDNTATMAVIIFNKTMSAALGVSCKDMVLVHGYDDDKRVPPCMLQLIGASLKYIIRLRLNSATVIEQIETNTIEYQVKDAVPMLPAPEPKTRASKSTRRQITDSPGGGNVQAKKLKMKNE